MPSAQLDAVASFRDADAYRDLCDFLPWGYLVIDEVARIEEVNAAAVRLLGRSRGDLIGASLQAYLSDHEVGALLDILAQCRTIGVSRDGRLELNARDGHTRNVKVHVQSFGTGGRALYRVAMLDVTEVRRANLALRRVADEMRDLYQNAPCGYHSLDPEGIVVQINDTELRWLGYARDEVVRRMKLTELMPEHRRAEFSAAFASLRQKRQVRDLQLDFQRKNGSVFPVLLSATALLDGNGEFLQSRASVFDITRRKLAEEEAKRYAERLKGMSRRAAEVQEGERRALAQELHDRVGQNLTALNINLNILKSAIAPTPAVGARLDDSLELVDKTVESIRNVMTELRPAVLDDYGLAAMLRWYADDFSRRTGVAVGVVGTDPKPRLPPSVERTLFRIVQEALNNVVKHAAAARATLLLDPQPDCFELTIADEGCGFDPGAPEPLNSQRGWGLMIMRERAESVDSQLVVESKPGRGTRVTIRVDARP
jgi:PAS domain S-box-containing protein